MLTFNYQSVNRDGEITKAKGIALNKEALIEELGAKGEIVLKCSRSYDIHQILGITGVKLNDIIIFTRQLAVMMQAGINLQSSLDLISQSTENEKLRYELGNILDDLKQGRPLSEGMLRTGVFDNFLVGLIKIAEVSGSIDEVMERAAEYYEKEGVLRKKIIGALMYPIILLVLSVVVVTFLILTVVPMFSSMFKDMGMAELPAASQIVMGISEFLQSYGFILLGLIIAGIIALIRFFKIEVNKKKLDKWLLDLPKLGLLIKKINGARFARSMDLLLKSGVTIMESFELIDWIVSNLEIRERLNKSREVVVAGQTYAKALQQADSFPDILVNMVRVGEETGSLETVLDKTSTFFEQEAESAIDTFIRILEPIILAFIGILILFIILAVFLPMFELYNSL